MPVLLTFVLNKCIFFTCIYTNTITISKLKYDGKVQIKINHFIRPLLLPSFFILVMNSLADNKRIDLVFFMELSEEDVGWGIFTSIKRGTAYKHWTIFIFTPNCDEISMSQIVNYQLINRCDNIRRSE